VRHIKKLNNKYLNDGGKLKITRNCDLCDQKKTYEFLKGYNFLTVGIEIKLENNGIADIALFDKPESVCYILEIMDTHRTKERSGEWFELKAKDVINCFIQNNNENIITIEDVSRRNYEKCAIDCENCISLLDIAEGLGYCENNNKTLAEKVSHSCWTKKFPSKTWSVYRNIECVNNKKLEILLEEKSKCLYCTKSSSDIKAYRPFCGKCYRIIKNNDCTIYEEPDKKLKEKYLWLMNILKCDEYKEFKCLICTNTNYANKSLFFCGNRQICIYCINNYGEKCHDMYQNRYKNIYELEIQESAK